MKTDYFEKYSSASVAGSSNQHYFISDGTPRRSRIFYKISVSGTHGYSLAFSSFVNGPFRAEHPTGLTLDSWEILSAKVARCTRFPEAESGADVDPERDAVLSDFRALTFCGKAGYKPSGGEFFFTDELTLEFQAGDYLCLELEFRGEMIPSHPESQLPIYTYDEGEWKYSQDSPVAEMIGCTRKAPRGKIAFLGDSITQGIGAGFNSYRNWCALLAEKIGNGYSYHNIGIGYATALAAASDGAWLSKAKSADTVFLCLGVNDLNRGRSAEDISRDLETIISALTMAGCRIILQTVPPFDYPENTRGEWEKVNKYIHYVLKNKIFFLFDPNEILSKSESEPHVAKYGGHPNGLGCALWAEAFYEKIRDLF